MFCPNCGTQMPDTAGFCRNCGIKMEQAAAMAIHAPKISFAPVTPVGKREFLRKHAHGKTKTAAVFAVITMLISIAVLVLSAYKCLNTDLRDIPVLDALGVEEAFEDLEKIDTDELEEGFDLAQLEMSRSEWKYVKEVKKSLYHVLDNFSVMNLIAFVHACDEVLDEEILERYGIDPEQYLDEYEDAYEILQGVCDYAVLGVCLIFALPALFALLGGLNKSTVLSVLALVFSLLPQLALCELVWMIINAAVLIVQIILCATVKRHYKTFRSGSYR